MPFGGLGRLGLWLSLRDSGKCDASISVPATNDPVLILFADEGSTQAADQVTVAAKQLCPKLHVLETDEAQAVAARANHSAMRQLIIQARPFAVLILGEELPLALIVAASDAGVPIVLGNLHIDRQPSWLGLQRAIKRDLLARMHRIFVTDYTSLSVVRQMVGHVSVNLNGRVTKVLEPLPCNEAERANLAALLNGRHTWLAASLPVSEEQAVLDAHLAALHQTHLALLLLVPAATERADILADQLESHGLIVARRNRDEEPVQEVQVMIADSFSELGLWYRLAPVTFMGGTLSGDDANTRHPFEPTALGSAVVHGPKKAKFAAEWRRLDDAGACRQVNTGTQLATVIAELSQPDLAAELANKAWEVSTSGAGAAMQIAEAVNSLARIPA